MRTGLPSAVKCRTVLTGLQVVRPRFAAGGQERAARCAISRSLRSRARPRLTPSLRPARSDTLILVRLNPGREKRLLGGHLWVFSNEIAKAENCAVQVHVFPAGEFRIESRPEFQERGNAPMGGDAAVAHDHKIPWQSFKYITDEANQSSGKDWQTKVHHGQDLFLDKIAYILQS